MKSKTKANEVIINTHPVPGEPAFLIEDPPGISGNSLVIADLHFGIEYSLALAGAHLPSQSDEITERILDLCSKLDVTQLIILGDIKHTVPITSKQEWHELPKIFTRLAEAVESIEIIPGNHDGNLQNMIPKDLTQIRFHPLAGTVLHGIGLVHGHTWPAPDVFESTQMLMAHNHPNVLFVDKLGGRVSYSCWLRGYLDKIRAAERYPDAVKSDIEIIIMPAFNDIGSGTPVNVEEPEFLGPMLKNQFIDLENANIYLLDGTALGTLSELIDISKAKKLKYFRKKRR
jgi:putative SbcD/Mre11-related phosphoesterase